MKLRIRLILLLLPLVTRAWSGPFIWVEGEAPVESEVVRHRWWYDQVKTAELSGGAQMSHWSEEAPGRATYAFEAPEAGAWTLWMRVNPTRTRLRISLNGGPAREVDLSNAKDVVNLAKDGKPDLRFLGWVEAGEVELRQGANRLEVVFASDNHHHGMLDAFTLVKGDFRASGTAKPDEAARAVEALAGGGWTPWLWESGVWAKSPADLRWMNETRAGEQGWIEVRDGQFTRPGDGQAVRFWGVNGPAGDLRGEVLQAALRELAGRGVNLVRIHGAVFDKSTGAFLPEKADWIREVVARAKQEGIYMHLSIYFPLWFEPDPGLEFLEGYDGSSKPFAALFFNPDFERVYRGWWRELLTGDNPHGPKLVDEPAVFGVELVNEDSFLFWTFAEKNLPEPQLRMLERGFHDWAAAKHGSAERALAAWGGGRVSRDRPEQGRLGFRTLWDIVTHRTARDRETAEFLARTQRAFYERNIAYLKEDLGFRGLVTCSNWHTASARYLKPLEIWSYLPGDFIDRHGYFGTTAKGEHTAWSIRPGHEYADRGAFRFEARESGGGRDFAHPSADPETNDKPSMLSETAWTRPNRYRVEAPLFYAAYGSLQGSDAIVHFAHDGAEWSVKPRFFMQPWTLASPTQMGQFPAAALMYRLGYLDEGRVLAQVGLDPEDLFDLRGTPLVQEGNLDGLRLAEAGPAVPAEAAIDPRIHFLGRTRVAISPDAVPTRMESLEGLLDGEGKTLRASNGQIHLDYGLGLLRVAAPRAQAAGGHLGAAGPMDLGVLRVASPMELGVVMLVPLDGRPLETSTRMLLQVMTEERPAGQEKRPLDAHRYELVDIGRDPWTFRAPEGVVSLDRPDAASLRVTALDVNGRRTEHRFAADRWELRPDTVYYLIESP